MIIFGVDKYLSYLLYSSVWEKARNHLEIKTKLYNFLALVSIFSFFFLTLYYFNISTNTMSNKQTSATADFISGK